MEFLSANCFVFLIIAIVAAAIAMINQIMRFVRMGNSMKSGDVGGGFGGFFKGIVIFYLSGFVASISAFMFVIGLIIRLAA